MTQPCKWLQLDCWCGRSRLCIPEDYPEPVACPVCSCEPIRTTVLTTKAETSRSLPYCAKETFTKMVTWQLLTGFEQNSATKLLTDSRIGEHHPAQLLPSIALLGS